MNDKQEAINTINKVAERLASRNHSSSGELQRIAQQLQNWPGMGGAGMEESFDGPIQNFDPSQEMETSGMIQPQMGGHPNIEPFVKMKKEESSVDNRKTHTCTVTFKAPLDITEAEMMNYILGIGKELGVDVDSFKWSKTDAKPVSPRV